MLNIAIATEVSNFIILVIQTMGYPGIFLLMVLEGVLVPIPSEVIMAFGGYMVFSGQLPAEIGIPAFVVLVIAGSVGNMVGAFLAYLLGDYGGIPLIVKYGRYVMLDQKSIEKTHSWFLRYGPSSVFLTRLVPVFRTFISIPAGIAKMNRTYFLLLTLVGAVIWDSILVYLGFHLGPYWTTIINFFNKFTDLALVALVVIIIGWVWTKMSKRNSVKKVD